MPFPISGSDPSVYESRAGIMRAGATRAGTFNHDPRVQINGVDRHDNIDFESQGITLQWSRNASPSAAFRLVSGSKPAKGAQIIISDGEIGNRLFGGYIVDVVTSFLADVPTVPFYDVTCQGWEYAFDRVLIWNAWGAIRGLTSECAQIVLEIAAVGGLTLTTDHVDATGVTMNELIASGSRPLDLVRQIGKFAGADAYIDPRQVLHFSKTDRVQAPEALTDTKRDFAAFKYTENVSQVATDMIGFGGIASITAAAPCASDVVMKCPIASDAFFPAPIGSTAFIPRLGAFVVWSTDAAFSPNKGTTLIAAAAASAIQVQINDRSFFLPGGLDGGWARCGQQVFRYHAGGGVAGSGFLTGIPSSGPGSIQADIPIGSTITAEPHVVILSGLTTATPTQVGDELVLVAEIQDAAAVAALAAIDGTDGIRQDVTDAGADLGYYALNDVVTAALSIASPVAVSADFQSRDPQMLPPRTLSISLATAGITATIRIERVTIQSFGVGPREVPPWRTVVAALDRHDFVDVLARMLKQRGA